MTILKLIQFEEEILFREGILGFDEKLSELQWERNDVSEQIKIINNLRLKREQIRELQFSDGFVYDLEKLELFELSEVSGIC